MFGLGKMVLVGCWECRDCLSLESWWESWMVRRGLERKRRLTQRSGGGFGSDRRVGRGEVGGGRGGMGGEGSRLAFWILGGRMSC